MIVHTRDGLSLNPRHITAARTQKIAAIPETWCVVVYIDGGMHEIGGDHPREYEASQQIDAISLDW